MLTQRFQIADIRVGSEQDWVFYEIGTAASSLIVQDKSVPFR
jgi:hypothetical protein